MPAPWVKVDGFMDSGIHYDLRFYLEDYANLLEARDKVLRRVWYAVTREGQQFRTRTGRSCGRSRPRRSGWTPPRSAGASARPRSFPPWARRNWTPSCRTYGCASTETGRSSCARARRGTPSSSTCAGTSRFPWTGRRSARCPGAISSGRCPSSPGRSAARRDAAVDEVWLVEISKGAIAPDHPFAPVHPGGLELRAGGPPPEEPDRAADQQGGRRSVDPPRRAPPEIDEILRDLLTAAIPAGRCARPGSLLRPSGTRCCRDRAPGSPSRSPSGTAA